MGMKAREPRCLCERTKAQWSYGPRGKEEDTFRAVESDEHGRMMACAICGSHWKVVPIHGGGLYSDYEWTRFPPPEK